MNYQGLKTSYLFFLCACFVISCNDSGMKTEHPIASVAPDLNHVKTNLPEAPGYQVFYNNCLTCHSDRYVLDQPDMPAQTWTAIVTKMQKTFGAPVADSSAEKIIQYLVAIKGLE